MPLSFPSLCFSHARKDLTQPLNMSQIAARILQTGVVTHTHAHKSTLLCTNNLLLLLSSAL